MGSQNSKTTESNQMNSFVKGSRTPPEDPGDLMK